MRQTFAYLDVP